MTAGRRASAADRQLLPEGRLAGPMPWVIAIMTALTVLAAAAGLALGNAAATYTAALSDRISVQLVEADPVMRDAQAGAVVAGLRAEPGVRAVRRLGQDEIARLLAPWLGPDIGSVDLPVPALVDADLSPAGRPRLPAILAAIRRAAPSARIDDHAGWLAPLGRLIVSLEWLALALVLMMAGATAAVVVLAARGALDTHRATIDVLHLMGSTDQQVARLFQRRIALDALFGSLCGSAGAVLVLWLLGRELEGSGSAIVAALRLGVADWAGLALFPAAAMAIAMVAARLTVTAALRRIP